MNGHSFSITPRQTTAFAGPGGHGAGPSPTLIDWEYANDLFLDDSGARNGSRGNNDAANDAPPGGEPRPGQDDGRTALPVTTSFLKRKMFDAGEGGGGDEKRARSGGDTKNRGRGGGGGEVTLLYPDQQYRGTSSSSAAGGKTTVLTPQSRLIPRLSSGTVTSSRPSRARPPPDSDGSASEEHSHLVRPPPAIHRKTLPVPRPGSHPLVRTIHQPRPPSPLGRYDPEMEAKLSSPPPRGEKEGEAAPLPSLPSIVGDGPDGRARRVAVRDGVARTTASTAPDSPGRMYHIYKFLKEVYPAIGGCTFLLPGLAETRRRWEGKEDEDEEGEEGRDKNPCVVNVSGVGSYRVGHLPGMSVRDQVSRSFFLIGRRRCLARNPLTLSAKFLRSFFIAPPH